MKNAAGVQIRHFRLASARCRPAQSERAPRHARRCNVFGPREDCSPGTQPSTAEVLAHPTRSRCRRSEIASARTNQVAVQHDNEYGVFMLSARTEPDLKLRATLAGMGGRSYWPTTDSGPLPLVAGWILRHACGAVAPVPAGLRRATSVAASGNQRRGTPGAKKRQNPRPPLPTSRVNLAPTGVRCRRAVWLVVDRTTRGRRRNHSSSAGS
jgi:hypothetical protein